MNLFDRKKTQQQVEPDMRQAQQSVQGIKADPAGFIRNSFGIDIPPGVNDPLQIIQQLAGSGKLNSEQMQRLHFFQSRIPALGGRR